MQALTYVEIDIDYCALTYGVAPCTASIPATGSAKCFNSPKTCQDRVNYTNAPVTLRFAKPTDYLPPEIECIPCIESAALSPAAISLGENLGQRAALTVTFIDHRHSDTGTGFDKYLADRGYDPFKQGTFWGKFRARHPFLRGKPLRLITGARGQALTAMETRHYLIESFDGPTPDGKYTITAKDPLKLADGDRAQAPRLSNGFLVAAIAAGDLAATLSPAGIGDAEYPASGWVAIGGKEICAFTRAADVITLTRAQLGTSAQAHNQQDRVQLVLRYAAVDPADIIRDLLVTYADVPASYIPLAAWQAETAAFLARVYTATIAEPTSVATLVAELIEQAALALWWDDSAQQLKLQVLRAILSDVDRYTEDNVLADSLKIAEQPDKRLSQVWVYFGQINPLRPLSDADNFRSSAIQKDSQAETDYGAPAIKIIKSRWIPALGRTVADRLGVIQLGRYRDPPRRFELALLRGAGATPLLGQGYRLAAWPLQDASGLAAEVPVQLTRLNPAADRFLVTAEEALFTAPAEDLSNRQIVIDANTNNVNLRSAHDSLYPPIQAGQAVTCIIRAGVIVGSDSVATPAFDVGSWPAGVTRNLVIEGRIQGKAGDGGGGGRPTGPSEDAGLRNGSPGQSGGVALYCRASINLDVDLGKIWGGAGGGGGGAATQQQGLTGNGSGGGGGAGQNPGLGGPPGSGSGNPGLPGQDGTPEAGGSGGAANAFGGNGGGPAQAGQPGTSTPAGSGGAPGAPGAAIDGVSFVTVTQGPGDIRGVQIN